MSSRRVWASWVLCIVAAGVCPTRAQSAEALKYSILYTGRLFGYFRYPNIQPVDQQGCPAEAAPSYAAQAFLDQTTTSQADLRLAMGDNFAPEALSVKMYDAGRFEPRSLYVPYHEPNSSEAKWWPRSKPLADKMLFDPLRGMLPSDSVACFLQAAKFQAIVPGKDDFYYGPEYISSLARFLHAPHGAHSPAVEMLGANLIVATTRHNAPKALPPDELPAPVWDSLIAPKTDDGEDEITIAVPEDVLPWLREVKVKVSNDMAARTDLAADLCLAEAGDSNVCLTGKGQRTPLSGTRKDNELTYLLEQDHNAGETGVTFTLLPDRNYAFCLHWGAQGNKPQAFCKTFTVRQPLFQVTDQAAGMLPEKPGSKVAIDAHSPAPYYVSVGPAPVVVFGVVDKALMQEVGLLNNSYWNDNVKYDTGVKVIDPAKALAQVLILCEHDANCRGKSKILMAQMSPDKARDLIDTLEKAGLPHAFDVVVTQVDARDYTGRVTLTARRGDSDVDTKSPLILTPAPHFPIAPKDNLSIKIQQAEVSIGSDAISLTNQVTPFTLSGTVVAGAAQFQAKVNSVYQSLAHKKTAKPQTAFESLALIGMQRHCDSDLAIMQPRDVYEQFQQSATLWSRGESNEVSDALFSDGNFMDEALWKGDVIVCRVVSGADLTKVLKESDANSDGPTKLTSLGVEKDDLHGNYIVGSQAVEEKRLYSVALTAFLAYGTTGYPELSASDVGPAESLRSTKKYELVSDAALEELSSKPRVAGFEAAAVYDHVHTQPPLNAPGFDEMHQFADWLKHWAVPYAMTPELIAPAKPDADALHVQVQERGYNYFNLEKFTLGYALTAIEGSQQLVPVRFGGISNVPELQTLESQSVNLWGRIRYGHVFPKYLELFGITETRYGFGRTRQTASAGGYDPYKINITENALQSEMGLLSKRISAAVPLRLLLSERLATQLRSPLLSYSALALGPAPLTASSNCQVTSIDATPPVTAATSANILCAAPRSVLQETKMGARLENRDNWLEFGWEAGHNFDSVTGYIFNKGTGSQLDCSAKTNQSVTTCVSAAPPGLVTDLSPLYVTQQTLHASGWFLNFKISAPLYGKIVQFSLENYSEVFLKHTQDTSADTRFYQDMVVSLPVKIWQNLSIAPQVEIFNYQNKVLPQHFLSLTSKLTLDYSFDWHSGLKASRATAFPDAGTATKTSPLPAP